MTDSERKNITDIIYAFREINKDIRNSFDEMSNELKSKPDFKIWKKWKKGNKKAKKDYKDYTSFFDGDDWYYLNCYGYYNKKVVGFTFVMSVKYDEKTDKKYCDFINQLDKDINKNTPMLCIAGIYTLIDDTEDAIFSSNDDATYPDDILQFSDEWKNYDIAKIAYDKWIDVEMEYEEGGKLIEGYKGWYKEASVKIVNITDISSKEVAHTIIDDLIEQAKRT